MLPTSLRQIEGVAENIITSSGNDLRSLFELPIHSKGFS